MEIVVVVGTLLGVILGDRLAYFRERTGRKHEFVRRQIEEFYSPLVGLRHEIRAKSELRQRVSSAAKGAWRELCNGKSSEELHTLERDRFPAIKRIIEYENRQLAEELLPNYRRMLDLFRDKYWLASESTRSHYPALVEFVEVWNRWEKDSLPWEVVSQLDHSEEAVKPLYDDLEFQLLSLRSRVASGKA